MADTKKQIVWLDMQDAGYRLFLDGQDRMVLDEINTPAPEETRQALINMGFEETQSGFAGPYTALIAYGLSKLPGARPVEMDREMATIGYRKVLLENTQAFVQEIIDSPDTEADPALVDEQEIGDFLDDLVETEANEAAPENEVPDVPEEPEPEIEEPVQAEGPTPILAVNDVAVFNPHKKTLRTDIGMVSEVIRSTTNRIGYHIVAQDDDGPRSQRVWESDYDIQVIDAGFSWNTLEGQKEVVAATGFVFQVSVAGASEHEAINAEDIGAVIQKDTAALEARENDPGQAENETPPQDEAPGEETNFDAFISDIPEPRKSRIVTALSEIDAATNLPRWAVIENHVSQGFAIATNEENNRKKRGLVSPDGQFMDGFSKTELDYATYLLSLNNTLSDSPDADSADLNTLREKARELGLEKEADILWLNKDASGLEKLISDNSPPVEPKVPELPWGPDEQYRVLDGTSFQTPSQNGSPDKTTGERVLLKDYPGFEFVVYPDKKDKEAFTLSEFRTGMRITTAYDGSMDSAVQKGLASLEKNTPEPSQLRDVVENKQINAIPEGMEDYGVIAFDDNPEGLESRPAEESHDEPQPTFDEQKQELRRQYSDRGYSLYYKVSDESWNLTNNQTRTVGQNNYMAGDIALSLEKEAFLAIDACIDGFENLFWEETWEETSQTEAEADEPESVPAESVPDATPETKTKPAILPYKEQFGSGAAKSIGKLLNDLGIAQDVATSEDYYARIENGEYMDLVIEKHSDELFLTHYYEQNGDLIMDNELVFKVNEETGHLIFKEVALQNPKGGEIRAHDKGFANMFAKNIVQQGFGEGKILHTTMSEANRMQEDEEQADFADVKDETNQDTAPEKRPYYEFKNETWQDYEPGQLPYYELGGKPIDAEDIEPYAFQEDEDGKVSMINFFPGKEPLEPQEILEKLARYKATEEKNLDFYISKYKEVAEKGIEAVSEEDRQDMSDDKAVATALFLEHSHIAYSKGYLAAIDAVFFEMDAQQNIPDTQKENVAVVPEKIAFTDKSVSDNIQRAVVDNGEIEIINKSGRKIVSRKTFSLAKWESLSKSFGNPEYNKREFVKSLGLVKDDGTPESDSLKQRIIDSQVKAIDTVYKKFKAGQKPVNEKPAAKAFNPTTPEGYAKVMSDPTLQEEYQDSLDSLFNTRIIDVRNALRDMGWEGEQYKDLYKHGELLKVESIAIKSGANIIGFSVNGIRDDISKTPEQFAKEIDEKHTLNFHEVANESRIGVNQDGVEIHQADNGNRYLLENGVKKSAPMALSPDRTMKAYSPEDHFKKGRAQFLTSEEMESFAKPAKVCIPSIDEIPVGKSMFFTGDELNLRRLLMTGGLPDDPEKIIPLIEKKMRLTEVSFDTDAKRLKEISSQPDPNEVVLDQVVKSLSESKSRLEALVQARDEQTQLLDEQQTIRM